MKNEILACIENNIATRLLLAGHLGALGYHVTVVSRPRALRRYLTSRPVDWLILDEAALAGDRDVLARVAHERKGARIVWLGRPPRQRRMPVEAVFATPLRYDEITRFFSRWAPGDTHRSGGPSDGDILAGDPGAGRKSECCHGRDGRQGSLAGAELVPAPADASVARGAQ